MSFFPLYTERLVLRAISLEDGGPIAAYHGLASVARYVPWPPRSRERVEELIPRWMAMDGQGDGSEGVQYAIALKDSGVLVGDCVLMFGDRAARQGEIGYVLHPDHHGHGYATEAMRAVVTAGFAIGRLHRIAARCDARNTASWRVMEKLGMRREAHFREHAIFKGEWDEEFVYAVLEDEWRAMQENM